MVTSSTFTFPLSLTNFLTRSRQPGIWSANSSFNVMSSLLKYSDFDQRVEGADRLAYCFSRFLKGSHLLVIKLIFQDLHHAPVTQLHWHSKKNVVQAIFTLQVSRGGHNQVLILENGFHHLGDRRSRSIKSAAGFQQANDLPATLACAFDNCFQAVGR